MARHNGRMVWALGILVVTVVGVFWLVSEKTPLELRRNTHEAPNPEQTQKQIGGQEQTREVPLERKLSTPPKTDYSSHEIPQEDLNIVSKLKEQGVSDQNTARLIKENYVIPDEVFEHLSKAVNWMPELQKASSSTIMGKNGEPTMLRIYDIANDSILWEFGIRDGDIIALIDGEIPVFELSRAIEYTQKAYDLIADLQNGYPVSITLLRNSLPVHLVYQKW